MLLSVIIPVYNEKSTVEEVIDRILKIELPCEKEIIVVDDGSNDGTVEVLRLQETKITRLYLNPVNVGKGAALRIGLSFAKGDVILFQDADLETNPEEYLQLLQPILDGKTSVVYGSRFLRRSRKISSTRYFANFFLTSLTNLLYGSKLTDMETAYKIFTSEVAKN
jgi:glycosyltransferase involved in cell wall biosynthesis